jgi:primosomal protein N''
MKMVEELFSKKCKSIRSKFDEVDNNAKKIKERNEKDRGNSKNNA